MGKFRQFLALAGLTATEAVRQPICFLLTAASVFLTGAVPLTLLHRFAEEGKIDRDSGLAFHFVFGLFVAAYAACSSLSREMRKGTAAAVLSKPVSREVYFLAKYAGVCAVVIAFSLCSTVSTLLADRVAERLFASAAGEEYVTDYVVGFMLLGAPLVAYLLAGFVNYRLRRPFQSTAFGLLIVSLLAVMFISGFLDRNGSFNPYDLHVQWRILPVSILITMALLLLTAVALALSSRFSTVPTLTITAAVLLAGLMSDYLFGRKADVSVVAATVHRLLPDFQNFWLSDALIGGGVVPWFYVGQSALYVLVYSAGVLCVGLLLFRQAEVK